MFCRLPLIVTICIATWAPRALLAADRSVDYLEKIKPLLRERCYVCHGALKQEADLRLDTVAAMIADDIISRGDASQSTLLERVSATEASERMPPEHEGEPLSSAEVTLIRDWIASGAPAPEDEQPEEDPADHWAFQPVTRPDVPDVGNTGWVRNPVDAFLAQQHEEHDLVAQPEASRLTLLRRLYLDLIGIPPTANEIAAFESDPSPDWYEKTVTRLLEDPHHGERWARHWMDIWRYSDWWGFNNQLRRSQKHIWHWRDWIVDSLNNDAPYDEMVSLMLAADEMYPEDLDKLRATGYLARNFWLFNRNQWMEETVEHVSKGFLGLKMNCAKCHDHKYDPIEQTDFYRMRAFFEPYHVRTDVLPGESDLKHDGIPRVFDGWPDKPTYRFERGQEKQPDKSTVIPPGIPAFLAFDELNIQPVSLPSESWQPERRSWVIDAHLSKARNILAAAQAKLAQASKKRAAAEANDSTPLADAQLQVAEAALAAAEAVKRSVDRRAETMRAEWAQENAPSDPSSTETKIERTQIDETIRAERQARVATTRHDVAVAELTLLRAEDAKKDAAKRALNRAQASLKKAIATAEAKIKPTDHYTPLAGAQFAATRFEISTKDDPTVPFVPQSTGRRTALARWITDRRNPLTARVAVNHIWMRHFGVPLVPTVFDFGRKGVRPAHPQLVDWLAAELMDNGWKMKSVHRAIVTSTAYRMSSSVAGAEANAAKDPDNRYWWRRVPIRLESQAVRDTILAHAGTLDPTMHGRPVFPAQQAASKRRSLYFFHSNNERNLFLTMFDDALVTECYQREQSIVPQQALALSNSKLVLETSERIAQRFSERTSDDARFIREAFLVLLGIEAGDEEITASTKALKAWQQLPDGSAEQARSQLIWALINHNDFVTLR